MSILETIFTIIVTAGIASMVMALLFAGHVRKTLDAVGTREIRKCTVDTPGCHSNWYEIVWKEEK